MFFLFWSPSTHMYFFVAVIGALIVAFLGILLFFSADDTGASASAGAKGASAAPGSLFAKFEERKTTMMEESRARYLSKLSAKHD